MAKRFTATEKWLDPWFCGLSIVDRLFWIYLCDNCDHSGIWQVNKLLINTYFPGYSPNPGTFGERIRVLGPEKWLIVKFVEFQYGSLNPANRAHASVIARLQKEGASKGLTRALLGPKDKDKEQDKDKDVGDGMEGEYRAPDKITEPIKSIVYAYKLQKGFEPEDRRWDKHNWPRCMKPAKELWEKFENVDTACDCIEDIATELEKKSLTWTLETIAKHADEWKVKHGPVNR